MKIMGGLGNQMFQYALARTLEKKTKYKIKLDITEFNKDKKRSYELDNLNIKKFDFVDKKEVQAYSSKGIINRIINNFFPSYNNIYKENKFEFDQNIFTIEDNKYIIGYWQSEKYFKDIENIIRKDFKFPPFKSKKNNVLSEKIMSTNSVSVHIRRGDYVHTKSAKKLHGGICDLSYYNRAIRSIEQKIDNPIFYVFSDEIRWAKDYLNIKYPLEFVDWNKDKSSFRDMQLMSLCKNNIIANSTFSWWGAWLNSNKNKNVIAPKKWFNDKKKDAEDLVLDSWIRV